MPNSPGEITALRNRLTATQIRVRRLRQLASQNAGELADYLNEGAHQEQIIADAMRVRLDDLKRRQRDEQHPPRPIPDRPTAALATCAWLRAAR